MKKAKYLFVGIVSILILLSTTVSSGFTLENTYAEKQIMAPASMEAVLEVTTDKTVYNLSEPVAIFLTNVGDEILCAGGPIVTIYNNENEIVYQEACYCWWELETGEYITWPPWDQTDQNGDQVPVGKYVVEGFLSGGGENYVDTATFFIINYDPPGSPSGPTEGSVGVEYIFCIVLPDNEECEPYYVLWDFGDGTASTWLGPYVAGETVCLEHSWSSPGDYIIRVKIKDGCGNEYWSDPLIIHIKGNGAPSPPIITGPTKGKAGVEYEYTVVSIDPEGDPINYIINWGDGTDTQCGGESGEEVTVAHTWDKPGYYTIRGRARDIHGHQSAESGPLEVTMPRNRVLTNSLLLRFLEQFQNAFPILR